MSSGVSRGAPMMNELLTRMSYALQSRIALSTSSRVTVSDL